MHLPHLPPVRFAQTCLHRHDKEAKVACVFPSPPSRAMLIEAAAQSTAALGETQTPLMGFLVMCKEVRLHVKPTKLQCTLWVKERLRMGEMSEFSFEAFDEHEVLLATGLVTIALAKA